MSEKKKKPTKEEKKEKVKKEKKERKEKEFEVRGYFVKGEEKQGFSKKIKAFNELLAAEYTLSLFGSKNKLRRSQIFIEEVKEAK